MKVKFIAAIGVLALGASPVAAQDMEGLGARAPSSYKWSGFHAGVNGGYGWDSTTNQVVEVPGFGVIPPVGQFGPGFFPANIANKQRGYFGGVQAGYDFQLGSLVLGIESDIQYADIQASSSINGATLAGFPLAPQPVTYNQTERLKWFGTTRGRLGLVAGERLLIYGTGGAAYGKESASGLFDYIKGPHSIEAGSVAAVKSGWTAGGGMEFLLQRSWSFKLEYLYYDLGNLTLRMTSPTVGVSETLRADLPLHGSIARVGLNYKFN